MSIAILRGDARSLPLPDACVDLIVTSPPYFSLRDYRDGKWSLAGQIGSEATPSEYLAALMDCTREWMRVLKPTGSMFINLGDVYSRGQRFDNEFTVEDAAWLAGVVDSDGAISIHKQGTSYSAWVRVGQMRPDVVKRIRDVTGIGTVCEDKRGCWHWQAAAQQASAILCRIWPWLHIKRRQALAGVELQSRKAAVGGKGRWNALTDDEIRHRERIRQAVVSWNAGEPDDYEPPLLPLPDLPMRARWIQAKSLIGLPWRYALACTDELGLCLRSEIIWQKVNGLPESVSDRSRRSHEQIFHFTLRSRYYSAVDEIREPAGDYARPRDYIRPQPPGPHRIKTFADTVNPLGKLPGSVWDIPSQPLTAPAHLGVDHFACVDTETEILTPRSWLRHDQLTAGEVVAGYDLGSNTARWTECTAINRYDYDGDMIAVESRDISMRLTPNHRTIVQRMDAYTKRRNPVHVIRADELDRYHFIPRSTTWEPSGDLYVGDRIAAVMGWVAAEGWYQGRGVWLSQSLEVNGPHVAEIDKLMPAAEIRTERQRVYKGRAWTEVTWKLGHPMAPLIQHEMPGKLLPWWLVMATEQERRAALDAFIAGDGHRRPDGRIGIFQKQRHNLDVLQAVAVTLGYKTTIREGGGRFVLYLTEGGRSVTLRGTSGVGSKVRHEHYQGTVWCPTTGTGTFIARRNGSVFATGNSFPMELPRRIIAGWSPPGVCTRCGHGRRPVSAAVALDMSRPQARRAHQLAEQAGLTDEHARALLSVGISDTGRGAATQSGTGKNTPEVYALANEARKALGGYAREYLLRRPTRFSYACDCPSPDAPTMPALVVDPFGGTGTTALLADVLGRHGVSVDRSADYCRLARWRTTDPAERARAMQVPKPPVVPDGQDALFDLGGAAS